MATIGNEKSEFDRTLGALYEAAKAERTAAAAFELAGENLRKARKEHDLATIAYATSVGLPLECLNPSLNSMVNWNTNDPAMVRDSFGKSEQFDHPGKRVGYKEPK